MKVKTETNFSPVVEEKCPNAAYDLFSEIVTNVMNEACPLRRTNPNRNFPKKPWITKAILVSIKQEKPTLCELFNGSFK